MRIHQNRQEREGGAQPKVVSKAPSTGALEGGATEGEGFPCLDRVKNVTVTGMVE